LWNPDSEDDTMARILLAEDEEAVRAFVKRALEQDGHAVQEAEDGGIALDLLQSEIGGFDLLLSDIRMPVMDGIALALSAARDFPDMPIILMTGYADQRERAANLQALIEDVISKPFALADLRTLVLKTLEKRAKAA
jgi:two-component system, cell cycle response regulator CpdR